MRKITHIVIHCTATPQNTTVESIQRFWKEKLKWKSPGYHYIIDAKGNSIQLLEDKFVSNGVAGHNAKLINIAWIGGIDDNGKPIDNRSLMQKAALIGMIKTLRHKYPHAQVLGHRDFSPDQNGNGIIDPWERIKECPCFDAATEYANL
jgi:N-acetylmuramoyl-L-alanine amidase